MRPAAQLSVAKNAVRNAVSGAAAAAQRAKPSTPPTPAREEREIESWLGDLRGTGPSGSTPSGPSQVRPSAEPTRAMPDAGNGEPVGAAPQDDDSDDAATRAIPTPRKRTVRWYFRRGRR